VEESIDAGSEFDESAEIGQRADAALDDHAFL